MADPFIGEIKMVAFDFAPKGWATCGGQILPIAQNSALFSLLGTQFGGNGQTTFALPDLRGRVPVHQGQGPGLTNRTMGESGGSENVTLALAEMPAHGHSLSPGGTLPTVSSAGNATTPNGNRPARANDGESNYSTAVADGSIPLAGTTAPAGGNLPHNNMPPFLTVNFVIALQGIFPPRN